MKFLRALAKKTNRNYFKIFRELRKELEAILLDEKLAKSGSGITYKKISNADEIDESLSALTPDDLNHIHEIYSGLYGSYKNGVRHDPTLNHLSSSDLRKVFFNEAVAWHKELKKLPNPVPLYRAIRSDNINSIDINNPGDSWTHNKESAKVYNNSIGSELYYLKTEIPHDDIDWHQSIARHMEDGYAESEINMIRKPKSIEIYNKNWDMLKKPNNEDDLEKAVDTSDEQKQGAVDGKAVGYYRMHPRDFLNLTTDDHWAPTESFYNNAQKVSDYNSFVSSGDTNVMPFLNIDTNGKVLGHEGRHRAAALLKEGHEDHYIAVYLHTPEGYKHRQWKKSDMPTNLTGEFKNSGTGQIDLSKMEWIDENLQGDLNLNKSDTPKNKLGRGWTGEVNKFNLDLNGKLTNVINRYLAPLEYMLVGGYASKETIALAKKMGLSGEPGALLMSYTQTLDSQRQYFESMGMESDLNPDLLKFSMNKIAKDGKVTADQLLANARANLLKAISNIEEIANTNSESAYHKSAHKGDGSDPESTPKTSRTAIKAELFEAQRKSFIDFKRTSATEINKSAAVANHQSIKDLAGDQDERMRCVWMTTEFENVCQNCNSYSKTSDGQYIVYKLSDFKPAGYNVGRKKKDWKLSIPPIHPHCACNIVYLPPGASMLTDGTLTWSKK